MGLQVTASYIYVRNEPIDSFSIVCRFKQGNGLLPLLFNLAVENVSMKISVNTKATFLYKSLKVFAHVDKINILRRRQLSPKHALIRTEDAAKEADLIIN